jgi:uncharacterized protein (TIGR03086 family)
MSEDVDRWRTTAEAFDRRYQAVSADQWDQPTTCSDWTVRQLVDHAVTTQTFFGGQLGAEVASGAQWPAVREAMERALEKPDLLDGTVSLPGLGDMPKAMVLGICTNDMLIHTWDLARSIGADEQLPAEPVANCYGWLQQLPEDFLRAGGRFGPPVTVGDDTDTQTKMLAYSGRQP